MLIIVLKCVTLYPVRMIIGIGLRKDGIIMKVFRITKLVCFVVGAALIFVFKDFFVNNLRWFIGGLMILYGSLGVVEIILEKERPIYDGHGFLFFFVEMLVGITILVFIKEYSTVCVLWAAWSIFRESIELKEIVDRKLHSVLAVVSGIESVAVIVLSVMLLMEPGEHHALIHTYFLCIEFVLTASIPIINQSVFKYHGGHNEKKKDAPAPNEKKETDEVPSPVDETV